METEEREDASQKHAANVKAEAEEDVTSCHTCGVCGRSFPLLSSLSQHMRRHTREKPYKCPYCEHRTAQKGSLKAHIRSHKLGLFSHNLSDKQGDEDQGQKDDAVIAEPPEISSTSEKALKGKDGIEVGDGADAGSFSCTICGQAFPQVLLLKSHMKRHRGSQDHGCRICGRRFRQAWFLQSHMRIHRVKAQLRGSKSNDPPATINGVPQDPASLINEECLYELCAGCGNFFFDRKTLRIHEKLHKLNQSRAQMQNPAQEDLEAAELHNSKKHFFDSLNLTCAGPKETPEERSLGRRIPELDPVCSYQAWQLATRGRLVEATEKCLGWEERLADAEVAYDTEKGEYVPLKQEKKRKQIESSSTSVKKKKSKHPSKDSRSSDGTQSSGKAGLPSQKKSGEHNRAAEGGSKGSSSKATSSNSVVHSKSLPSFQPTSSPKHRGSRATVEGSFPQEGLGFMLARNHGGTSSNVASDRLHSRRQSYDFASVPKGPDLWAAMNMWGLHGSKAYLDPLLFAQGKNESAGEMPMDIDIFSLLKNYSPHELAALYQHWGFVDPRLDPQGEQEALF
uniref:C2H2-type domain-containing protein n=1 Tax=Stegastes partitus TaxID=144197 RepID=A0A3B5AHX2_9TELE